MSAPAPPRRSPRTLAAAVALAALAAAGALAAPAAAEPVAGPAGRPAAPATATAATAGHSTWPTYHHDGRRTGVQTGMPAAGPLRIGWRATLDGAVYASPVLADGGVIAATENDTVYYLRHGRVTWSRHLGTPVRRSALSCGNIDPLGITGTPVFDRATDTVYVAAELAGPIRHVLVALDAATGHTRWSHRVDVTGVSPVVQQQRPALTLSGGRVYVEMGGLAGDCGDYHGWVVGMRKDGSGSPSWYRTPGTMAGIWSPPGAVTEDDGSLLVSVGNGGATTKSAGYDYSDSVLRLSGTDLHRLSWFAPAVWPDDNARDLDLGSDAPARVTLSSGRFVVIAGKRGVVYLLHDHALGGVGGAVTHISGCAAYGGSAVQGSVVYLPCSDGVRAVRVSATGLRILWHAAPAGSPVVGGGVVWSVDAEAGVLYALSPSTGAVLRHIGVGTTSRFATPALSRGGSVVVPTVRGVVLVTGG